MLRCAVCVSAWGREREFVHDEARGVYRRAREFVQETEKKEFRVELREMGKALTGSWDFQTHLMWRSVCPQVGTLERFLWKKEKEGLKLLSFLSCYFLKKKWFWMSFMWYICPFRMHLSVHSLLFILTEIAHSVVKETAEVYMENVYF